MKDQKKRNKIIYATNFVTRAKGEFCCETFVGVNDLIELFIIFCVGFEW